MSEPKEVPIYIATPDDADDSCDESSFIDPNSDPRKLLEHPRVAQWEPYVPAKTLEEVSLELRFGRPKAVGNEVAKDDAQSDPAAAGSGGAAESKNLPVENTNASVLPESAQTELPKTPAGADLPLTPDIQSVIDPSPTKTTNQLHSKVQSESPKRSRIWLYVTLTAINAFVLGTWIGSKFVPFETPKSSFDTPAQIAGSQAARAAVDNGLLSKHIIADVATRAGSSVVNIDIRYKSRVPPPGLAAPLGGFDHFFGREQQHTQVPYPMPTRISEGTGVIIRADGYILSNSHVVKPDSEIKVTLEDKRVMKARFIGRDSFTDLAVIKVEGKNLPVASFGTTKDVRPGDWAIAIGSPLGFDHTVTLGIVSAIGRSLSDLMKGNVELIQTDVAINPGSSGGPLLNIDGKVIGIIAAIKSGAQNIAFAIPVDLAGKIAEDIMAHGTIARPYLGIYMSDDDPEATRSLTLPTHPVAVIVRHVTPEGPCQKAGITAGAIIEKVKGKYVKSAKEVREITADLRPGEIVEFQLRRGPASEIKKVTVGFYPDDIQDLR